MKNLKKYVISALRFLLMVFILGTQALLKGSWTSDNRDQTPV